MLYQISNGAVAFGDDVILHSIDFEIRNTEKIAIVGRNGCGKTTLLKIINGIVRPDSGTIEIGQDYPDWIFLAGERIYGCVHESDRLCERSGGICHYI